MKPNTILKIFIEHCYIKYYNIFILLEMYLIVDQQLQK